MAPAKRIVLDHVHPDPEVLAEAGAIVRQGGLVAFPTETVYGLGGNALDPEAAKKIYAAKGRPSDNPLIVHIAAREDLEALTTEVPAKAEMLIRHFWPGPLTIILPRSAQVPPETAGGLATVAIRYPNHAIARGLIREAGGYIAAPSANLSGRPSPTTARHVEEDLGDAIDLILDGGPVEIGLESTIVDFTEEIPTILRPGYIGMSALQEILGPVQTGAILSAEEDAIQRPRAPGMKYRHYAPKGNLCVVEGTPEEVCRYIRQRVREHLQNKERVGILCSAETAAVYQEGVVFCIGSLQKEEEIARNLYGALRQADEQEIDHLYAEAFDTPMLGQAIMNRLYKAAGGNRKILTS